MLTRFLATIWLAFSAVFGPSAIAQQASTFTSSNLKGVGVDAKIGNPVPLDLDFANEQNESVQLGKLIDGSVPVFITLNYSNCPSLCIAQLGNLAKTINGLDDQEMQLGRDFKLISISIDPTETSERLVETKNRYAALLKGNHSPDGWFFLRGSRSSIAKIADATGFNYTYDEKSQQYNHAATAIGVSPHGVITRYLFDLALEPATLRLALVETSQGKLGTLGDQIMLWCYHYDPNENKYTGVSRRLMSIGGAIFVIVGFTISLPFWLSRRGRPAVVGLTDNENLQSTASEKTTKSTSSEI